jgi:molybdenum cofactor biosynthesis enzyme MoaA
MKTHTFSIVVGTAACNASCPHCISKMTRSKAPKTPVIDEAKFNIACRVVEQARDGLVHVLLTGKGEPMLFPGQIQQYMELMNFRFPLVELQTNGTLIDQAFAQGNLQRWQQEGLTRVCISIAHFDPCRSNELMGINEDYNFWQAVATLKNYGFSVRLNCTLLRNGVSMPREFERLVHLCHVHDVDQLTLREVDMPEDAAGSVAEYVKREQPQGAIGGLNNHLIRKGAVKLLTLPHGGIVFDYHGQNVCLSNCITSTTDPNDIRQLIFFPDGRLMYDWKYPAARLL